MIKVPNKRLQMVTYIYLMVFLRPPIAFYTSWLIDNAPDYQTMSQYVEQTQKEVDDVLTKLLQEASAKEEQHDWNRIAEHCLREMREQEKMDGFSDIYSLTKVTSVNVVD